MTPIAEVVVLLSAAVVAVPLLKWFGLASVMGYLVAGVVIGPWGLSLLEDPVTIMHTTEFGVVLLLFIIGLELQPARLWVLRRVVFGLGGAQVAVSTTAIALMAWAFGLTPLPALITGLALSMSSTAFVLQMLAERKQLTSRYGRDGFAVLLFQDLAVIPLLAIFPLLSPMADVSQRPPGWVSIVAVVGVVLAGRPVLRFLLRRVAMTDSHELLVMATLLIVVAMSWGMETAGLSMSLGAFLAGVLLADSEYRHELEANIEPFKGVLLGSFFVAVGMSANLGLVITQPVVVIGLACGLIAIKAAVLFGLGRSSGMEHAASRRFAIYLSQGGEFAFVLLTLASRQQLMDHDTADLLAMVVTLSMAMTPLLLGVHERWIAPALDKSAVRPFDEIQPTDHRVIIAGFGRFGQIVGRILRTRKISSTVLESSFEQVDFVRRFGNRVHFGDASRLDLLRAAGAENAEVFVLAIDDIEGSLKTAAMVRKHFPHLKIFARARNRFHYFRLRDLGIEHITRETFSSSVNLGGDVLRELGTDPTIADRTTSSFSDYDNRLIETQYAVNRDEALLIQTAQAAGRELEELFEADAEIGRKTTQFVANADSTNSAG